MEPTLGKFEMEKFDGKGDFGMWKYKMMGQLEIQGLLSVLKEDFTVLTESGKEVEGSDAKVDQKKADKDLRVRSLLGTCLSDSILRKIMHETTALGMWKALEKNYQTKSLPNRIYLKKQFSCYKMEEDKTIEENVDIFLKLIADLESLKVTISDEDQAIQLLSGLPEAYEPLVHTLQYGTGKETLTVNEVVTSAYSKEAELKQKGLLNKSKTDSEGLYVESRGRAQKRSGNSNGNSNNWRGRSKSRGKFQSNQRSEENNTGCFICGKEDHWKRECPERRRRPNSANFTKEPVQPLVLTVSNQDTLKEWIMDSGCSFHSTHDKEVLFDFKEYEGGSVLMANNTQGSIKGMGKIRIQNSDGSEVILKDVKYMPDVSRNLISYGMLEKSGCRYRGSCFKVQFYKRKKKVISGKYKDGLYFLQGTVVKSKVDTSKAEKEVKQKKLKVSFSESLIQGPSPYGFRTETTSARGGDSFSAEKYESSKETENGHAIDDYCLSKNEEKSNDKASSKENQRLDGFKKDSQFCIESFTNSDYATNDEEASATGFMLKVSDAETKSIITTLKREDVSNNTYTTGNHVERLKENAPDQKLQLCCELPNVH